MKEFWTLIIGDFSWAMFAALYFFAAIGVAINLLNHANQRDQASPNTPKKFSPMYLLKDNRRRIIIAILLIFVSIRFIPYLIDYDASQSAFWLVGAFFIGLVYDRLLQIWQAKANSVLKVARDTPAESTDKG